MCHCQKQLSTVFEVCWHGHQPSSVFDTNCEDSYKGGHDHGPSEVASLTHMTSGQHLLSPLNETTFLGVPSPFFPGILLFRKPSKTQGKQIRLLTRTMVKNGESTPRTLGTCTLAVAHQKSHTGERSELDVRCYFESTNSRAPSNTR